LIDTVSSTAIPSRENISDLISLYQKGDLQEALREGAALAEKYPRAAIIQNLLGAINFGLGDIDQALSRYAAALKINPNYAQAHYNLGSALNNIGDPEAAISSYAEALRIKPDYAEAHNNLGNALKNSGKPNEAIVSYEKALQLNPDSAETHFNLANALYDIGKQEEALKSYIQAISINQNRKDFWQNLSGLLVSLDFTSYSENISDIFIQVLEQKTVVRPNRIAPQILKLLKLHPDEGDLFRNKAEFNGSDSVESMCRNLARIPLFLRIIELCPIPDLDLEYLLTTLRRNLLLHRDAIVDKQGVRDFQISLALHCFTNEYIFNETDAETSAVRALELEIKNSRRNAESPNPYNLACLASYRPLHNYDWPQEFVIPEDLNPLFERQVNEVLAAAAIRAEIPRLKPIKDKVSSAVKAQYEENPYPRWINTLAHFKPVYIPAFLKQTNLRVLNADVEFSNQPDILVAGCGTGQHSISTATRFANSNVLAVDLSLDSLCYAARKTKELGVGNIEYMQADILDLGLLEKQFDIVESSGVLHHMADPLAGWKTLTDRLKPGGLMHIGLYSEIARRNIVEARKLISNKGLSNTRSDIIPFRKEIIDGADDGGGGGGGADDGGDEILSTIKTYSDFYSTSELRDLLFHVQEHRFTLPQIQNDLESLGLKFAGFEYLETRITSRFMQDYPGPDSLYSLEAWHNFEKNNPDTFKGMYQFWAQKI
jgi:2-polyprenyl-3-methyl-5-hydroxy-6-metoxy-1,4-benzoquinol methylase/Tfp pilus assembly protein PilF